MCNGFATKFVDEGNSSSGGLKWCVESDSMKSIFNAAEGNSSKVAFTFILGSIISENSANCTGDVANTTLIDFDTPKLDYSFRDEKLHKKKTFNASDIKTFGFVD